MVGFAHAQSGTFLFELQIAGQIRGNKYDITYIKRKGEGNKCMKNMQ